MSTKDRLLPIVLVIIFATGCLGMTFFMPWAEYGLLTQGTPSSFGAGLARTIGIDGVLASATNFVNSLFANLKDDPNAPYYVYGFFMALALISAAIGIAVIGREDAEEKTVLPVK